MSSRRKRQFSSSHRAFASTEQIASSFDDTSPYARKVIQLGVPLSHEVSELQATLKNTLKLLPARIATAVLQAIPGMPASLVPTQLAIENDEYVTATLRYIRHCVVILTLGDRLRFLKDQENLHVFLETLVNARDMLLQMRSDRHVIAGGVGFYKSLRKMINDATAGVSRGKKTAQTVTDSFSSVSKSLQELVLKNQAESQTLTETEVRSSEEITSSTAPELQIILDSLCRQWPDLLKTVDELQTKLEDVREKVDVALEVKSNSNPLIEGSCGVS